MIRVSSKVAQRKLRAISNTLAGLIVITFVLTVLLPTFIYLYVSQTTAALKAGSILKARMMEAPHLNITLAAVSGTEKDYIIVNNNPQPMTLRALVLGVDNKVAIINPYDAFNKTLAITSTASVDILPLHGDVKPVKDKGIRLGPTAAIKVIVKGASLLRVTTSLGVANIPPVVNNPSLASQQPTSGNVSYAETAGSIKTNYVSLNNFQSVDSLVNTNNSDIALVTNPADNTTNTSLLESGFMESYCFAGSSNPVEGGFKKTLNTSIEALFVHNLGPLFGMLVLGGRSIAYNETYPVSVYMPFYLLSPYNTSDSSDPGILVLSTKDYKPTICVTWVLQVNSQVALSYCFPHGTNGDEYLFEDEGVINPLAKALSGLLVSSVNTTSSSVLDTISGTASLTDFTSSSVKVFMSEKLGMIAYNDGAVIYCPPGAYNYTYDALNRIHISPTGVKQCAVFIPHSETSGWWWWWSTTTFHILMGYWDTSIDDYGAIVVNRYETDGNLTYGDGDISTVNVVLSYDLESPSGGIYFPLYPHVMKIVNTVTVNDTLKVYDGFHDTVENGTHAFGIYYYSGYDMGDQSYYSIKSLYGEGGVFNLYSFEKGATSGIEPFMVIADTDGNGLSELIFTDEWFKPGPKVNTLYDLSDVMTDEHGLSGYIYDPLLGGDLNVNWRGCIDKTLGTLYLKFGNKYAINGSKIAEVSVQIRYSFHDAVGADTEEIDDPKKGIWGFYVADSQGNIVTSSVYIYQQLAQIEDTWPPNTNFISQAVFLPIPDKPQLYYVLYGFSDAYTYTYGPYRYTNDLEYTVRVEWIGMWYLHR